MTALRIVFDEDGYPRELRTAADRERAIARGALTRDTDVVVYRDSEAAYACKAGSIPELWPDEARPEEDGENDAEAAPSSPAPAPAPLPAAPPPPATTPSATAAGKNRPTWEWPGQTTSVSAAPQPLATPKPISKPAPKRSRQPSPRPAQQPGGCLTTLFWLFVIYMLLKLFA